MSRPVIGIASYLERARWNIWDTRAAVVHESYVRGVTANGGRAVVLPPDETDADVLDRLDGLLLPGGADIGAHHYGDLPHPEADTEQPLRDAAELMLLRAALERDVPVLGVCRGLQLLAIVHGGSLHQHLPDVLGHGGHCPREGVFGEHDVEAAPGSVVAAVYGPRARVNSHHHQAVADPGGLRVTARSADGVVEAAEDPSKTFAVGVQWHPEVSGDDALFARFVAACASRNHSLASARPWSLSSPSSPSSPSSFAPLHPPIGAQT
ncbi:gamma-glutamyl-gamma-aminobutyrate hydrolase family protein [Streptomyces fructofermentans]|uniref:Gamma-glutamyl-gamma-aminobutyrate hydrolase n=1 Tax=Streptomyces fructofermentans TaxID=152141 RepID=A0A918K2J8_9ACTN|nr:gamma-glutamyl-gamma-aminobutyrate hydrolase family protein [Streptomyces fructofermentans]GGX44003.1 gamma-glutamyl-gamma-aminobutyrate hydrolase [Streptomyces fructofermentans]